MRERLAGTGIVVAILLAGCATMAPTMSAGTQEVARGYLPLGRY